MSQGFGKSFFLYISVMLTTVINVKALLPVTVKPDLSKRSRDTPNSLA